MQLIKKYFHFNKKAFLHFDLKCMSIDKKIDIIAFNLDSNFIFN